MHHYECVGLAPNVDNILQSGQFCAMSIASLRERFSDLRSCWVVFIHVVRGHPDASASVLQLRSVWHLIRLTFAQCGRTGRVAVLEQYRSRKMWLDLKRISPWNHAEAGRIPPPPESPCGSLGDATGRWKGIRPEKHLLQQFANVS